MVNSSTGLEAVHSGVASECAFTGDQQVCRIKKRQYRWRQAAADSTIWMPSYWIDYTSAGPVGQSMFEAFQKGFHWKPVAVNYMYIGGGASNR